MSMRAEIHDPSRASSAKIRTPLIVRSRSFWSAGSEAVRSPGAQSGPARRRALRSRTRCARGNRRSVRASSPCMGAPPWRRPFIFALISSWEASWDSARKCLSRGWVEGVKRSGHPPSLPRYLENLFNQAGDDCERGGLVLDVWTAKSSAHELSSHHGGEELAVRAAQDIALVRQRFQPLRFIPNGHTRSAEPERLLLHASESVTTTDAVASARSMSV